MGDGGAVGGSSVASRSMILAAVPVRFCAISVDGGGSSWVTQTAAAIRQTARTPAMAARTQPDGRELSPLRATCGGTLPGGGVLGEVLLDDDLSEGDLPLAGFRVCVGTGPIRQLPLDVYRLAIV